MKVYFQNHGFLHCDMRWLLIANNFGSRRNTSPPTTWYECPTLSLVIDHPDGKILFDTSCPRDWEDRWGPAGINEIFPYDAVKDEEFIDSSIKRLGLEPSDFKTVLLSHLHFDHAGNLRLFEGSGARFVAQKAEKEGAMAIPGEFQGAFIKKDYQNGFQIDTIEGDVEIAKGVQLITLPGHTWGTMGVLLDLPNSGPILYTSDAVYMKASYGPPPVGSPIVWSSLEWLNSVEKVRKLAEKHNARVVFSHDHDMVVNELKLAPAYYD
jgi:N-acyl homoserine lactone hydrolase